VNKVQRLAAELKYKAYHYHAAEKAEIIERFRSSELRVIVATNALSINIDIANIRAVVYINIPQTLLDYGQKNRRAKRNRKTSLTVIIIKENNYRR
jgi:superfamily II DNA helicase RecQ